MKNVFVFAIAIFFSFSLHAKTCIWTGAGGNLKWSTQQNWADSQVPQTGDTVELSSSSSEDCTIENDIAGLTLESLEIGGENPFTLSGEGISLSSTNSLSVSASAAMVIAVPLVLAAEEGTNVFSIASETTFSGVISGSNVLQLDVSAGTVHMAAANTYSGGTFWRGTATVTTSLKLEDAASLGTGRDVQVLYDGGHKLYFTTPGPYAYDFTIGPRNPSAPQVVQLVSACKYPDAAVIDGDITVKKAQYVQTRSYDNSYQGFHVKGDINAAGVNFWVRGAYGSPLRVDGKMTAQNVYTATIGLDATGASNSAQALYLASSGNEYDSLVIQHGPVITAAENALCPTTPVAFQAWSSTEQNYAYLGKMYKHGSLVLEGGYDQTVDCLESLAGSSSRVEFITASSPAVLTLRASKSAEAWCRLNDALSIVYWAKESATTQTINVAETREHTMSGSITVSNGVFAVKGGAAWRNVPSIHVADGAEFILDCETASAFSGVREVTLADNARFTVTDSAGAPFTADAVTLRLAESAVVTLPEEMSLSVKELWIGGVLQAGDATYSDIPQLSGGSVVTAAAEAELVEATWNAQGAEGLVSASANWSPASDSSVLTTGWFKPTFAASGQGARVDCAMRVKGLVFDLPGGAATNVFALTSAGGGSLMLRGDGVVLSAPAEGERDEIEVAVPVRTRGEQTWSLPENTHFNISGPLSSTELTAIAKTGAGVLELGGSNTALSAAWTFSGGDLVLSGGTNSLGCAGSGCGAAIASGMRLYLNGTHENAPITQSIKMMSFTSANKPLFPIQVGVGTTNVISRYTSKDNALVVHLPEGASLTFDGNLNTSDQNMYVIGGGELTIRGTFKMPYFNVSSETVTLDCDNTKNNGSLVLTDNARVVLKRPNILNSTATRILLQSRAGSVDLDGNDQITGAIHLSNLHSLSTIRIGSAKPATLSFKQSNLNNVVVTNKNCDFSGALSFVKTGSKFVLARSVSTTGDLTVNEGDFVFTDNGAWPSGKCFTVGGSGRIVISNSKSFGRSAIFKAADSGVFDIAEGVCVRCDELYIDGVKMPNGEYSAGNTPAHFTGAGTMRVGRWGTKIIVR